MNQVETIFRSGSLPDAQRAADKLRHGGIEALVRSHWDRDHDVLVPAVSTKSAVALLAGEQLDGELTVAALATRSRATVAWVLVAAAAACGLWLIARATG